MEDKRPPEELANIEVDSYEAHLELCRQDVNAFCEFVAKDDETGENIVQTEIHEKFQLIADKYKRAIIWAHPESGKMLPLDTPIPTPSGWTNMGDLQVGDKVFDQHGLVTEVTWVSPVNETPESYTIYFDDGVEIKACADHQWFARTKSNRLSGTDYKVVDTKKMYTRYLENQGVSWSMPVPKPVEYEEQNLPLPPADFVNLIFNKEKDKTFAKSKQLKEILKKRIPQAYLMGSIEQRIEFFEALIDTYNNTRFFPISKKKEPEFRKDVVQLIRSLGIKVFDKGKDSIFFRVTSKKSIHTERIVKEIRPCSPVPMRCISVSSMDKSYLCGKEYLVTHNTNQLSILRTVWELGNNPELRFVIMGKTQVKAVDIVRIIRKYIEESEEVRAVFPNLKPGDKWEEDKFTVVRKSYAKDPSVQALGLFNSITGKRIDRLITDDILDSENTQTPEQRERTEKWIKKTVFDRLTKDARVINMANAWSPRDFLHNMEREGGWAGFRFPVHDEDGEPTWPLKWSKERIQDVRNELGPLEFARSFLCRPRDDGESPFDQAAIRACIQQGEGFELLHEIDDSELPDGCLVVHGVDLAVGKKESSAKTVIFTALYWPDDESRQVLWVRGGKWSASEIKLNIINTFEDFGGIFVVENNAAQDWMIQITHETHAIPIVPFTTGKNKTNAAFGVESLAAEMFNRKWIIPLDGNCKREVNFWIEDMTYYSREAHAGDYLMASWLCREGIRKLCAKKRRKSKGNVRFVDFSPKVAVIDGIT